MAGSLWKQKLDSFDAEQLTAGPGYDYQPDCSSDGRWVVYSSYAKDAIELWALNLETGQSRQLTSGGAVNVEPRLSPDGKRIVFVSTSYHKHFHIFIGQFANGELTDIKRLTGETRSDLPRYYYSEFDHEISPAWSPDGSEIIFVSNRGHIYGTGGFWRMKAEPGAEAHEIHYEETTWKARPDFSPDGKRIVYASYLGQQWHQLWIMPSNGGDSFPLSYGDFDNINPRWSPDGARIAFISNRDGNTSLWTQEISGGSRNQIIRRDRRYLQAMGRLTIQVVDALGQVTSARLFVTGEDGRAYAPDNSWMHADDNFVRSERPFEAHYFHTAGNAEITVPAGRVDIEVMRGFESRVERKTIRVAAGETAGIKVQLQPLNLPQQAHSHWVSADVHVHMNYGGAYRNTPKHLVEQAAAENLSIVEDLIVNKEQRVPDIAYFSPQPDPASTAATLLLHAQEFHTSYWGHLGLLNLSQHFLIPGYAAYPNTAAASLYPTNADVADMAHQQRAVVGYVHPYDTFPDPAEGSYAHARVARRCCARQSGLRRGARLQRSQIDGGSLVSVAQLRLSLTGRGRHRCHGELRFFARAGRAQSSVCQRSARSSRHPVMAEFLEARAHVCYQRSAPWLYARWPRLGRRAASPSGRQQSKIHRLASLYCSCRSSGGDLQWPRSA